MGLIVPKRPKSERWDGPYVRSRFQSSDPNHRPFGITTIIGLATFIQVRACRVEYTRLRVGLNQLSEDVKHLMVAEQRRFLKELQSSKEEDASTTNDQPPGS